MREEYRAELADVTQTLVDMAEGVRVAMRQATEALVRADQTEAEEVVHGDAETDARYHQVEDKIYDLLARQAPTWRATSPRRRCGGHRRSRYRRSCVR